MFLSEVLSLSEREKCKGELRKNCKYKEDKEYKECDSLSTTGANDWSIVFWIVCLSF